MKHLTKLLFVFGALFLPMTLSAQSGQEMYAEANKINAEADKQLNAAYDQLIKSIRADNEKDRAELLVARLPGISACVAQVSRRTSRFRRDTREYRLRFLSLPWHGQLQCRPYEGTHQRPHNCSKSILNSPQSLTPYVLHWAAEATSQEFEIPVTPKLSAEIEKGLLEKNQHLTQVQLVVQTSQ